MQAVLRHVNNAEKVGVTGRSSPVLYMLYPAYLSRVDFVLEYENRDVES